MGGHAARKADRHLLDDPHYDRLAQALRFTSVWIAPAGTLE